MIKKTFLVIGILLSTLAFCQESVGTPSSINKWTFGGGFGLGFGSNSSFNISASPRVGYKVTEDLEAGLLGSLSLQTSDFSRSTMIGVGPFANYYLGRSFYVSGNLQQFFVNTKDKVNNQRFSVNETALYIGGGYIQSFGGRTFMQIGAMYNVLWKRDNSIFSSGVVPTVGFVVGL